MIESRRSRAPIESTEYPGLTRRAERIAAQLLDGALDTGEHAPTDPEELARYREEHRP